MSEKGRPRFGLYAKTVADLLPRLCRLMCGRALPFRRPSFPDWGCAPNFQGAAPIIKKPFRKGRALPHIRRQSRGNPMRNEKQPYGK